MLYLSITPAAPEQWQLQLVAGGYTALLSPRNLITQTFTVSKALLTRLSSDRCCRALTVVIAVLSAVSTTSVVALLSRLSYRRVGRVPLKYASCYLGR